MKIFKTTVIILLLAILGSGCEKDELKISDEKTIISSIPSINIYKAKESYKDKLAVCMDSSGNITCTPLFGSESYDIYKKDGHYYKTHRYFLKDGYVLEDISINRAFTDITIDEMVESFDKYGSEYWTHQRYYDRIINSDPFDEYYFFDGVNKPIKYFTLKEINDMIESGTLETVFEKIK